MSPLAALLSADVLTGLFVLLLAGAVEPLVEYRLERVLSPSPATAWALEHVLAPLLRAAIIAAFVLLAYPALFGVRAAPTLAVLLREAPLRMTSLVNVLFLLSVLLPLLLPSARRTAWLVPIQGLTATAMVFGWYAAYIGAYSIGPWPGAAPAAVIAVMVVVSHRLAAETGQVVGRWVDDKLGSDGFAHILPNAVELVAQLPAVLYYGLSLGRQIAI